MTDQPIAIQRVFLGWDRPSLELAIDYLVERYGDAAALDLEKVTVALPGARAGRRLLELLVQRAESEGRVLAPPTICTPGRLPEELYQPKFPFADDLVQQLAWRRVLMETDPGALQLLVSSPPPADDLPAWLALGQMLGRLHQELAAEGLDFADVARRGAALPDFREARRWELLADIQTRYLAALDRVQLWDVQTARRCAVKWRECRADRDVLLLGTPDLNRAQRDILDSVAERVTVVVFAPERLADHFDAHGCVRPEVWHDCIVPLTDDQIELADGPAEQASAALRAVAGLDGRYPAESISIGLPDEEVLPHLEERFAQYDVPVRFGPGTPLDQSAPCQLLRAVTEYLAERSFAALAALVRHPDVEAWLLDGPVPSRLLAALDRYQADHLVDRLEGHWLGRPEDHAPVRAAWEAVEQLLADLSGPKRKLGQWAEPIVGLLVAVYGHQAIDRSTLAGRALWLACRKIHAVLSRHTAIPDELMPEVAAPAALQLVLGDLAGETIPAPPRERAIEILGWLELPMDDAPAVVLTGFNEGRLPASQNADLFLPNQLRAALGIDDNQRRYARDAYAICTLAASRKRLHVIAGRRSAEGDPLVPSRLLLACESPSLARRVMRVLEPPASAPLPPPGLRPGDATRIDVPRAAPLSQPVAQMRVTEFRDYLACPFRYYLKHRLRLESLDDSAEELDGRLFGNLAHDALADWAGSDLAASLDAEAIEAFLADALRRQVALRHGGSPPPAVRVQVEQLRLRLKAFALWQAGWAAQGWRVERVEYSPGDGSAALVVDGKPMYLSGRIDRVDVNPDTGECVVFDYKTGDSGKTPDQAHRRNGQWIDLQLPLYRTLLEGTDWLPAGAVESARLGYILLPKDLGKTGHSLASWTVEELDSADAEARRVVRAVRAEDFRMAEQAPDFFEEYAAICQDARFRAPELPADSEMGTEE